MPFATIKSWFPSQRNVPEACKKIHALLCYRSFPFPFYLTKSSSILTPHCMLYAAVGALPANFSIRSDRALGLAPTTAGSSISPSLLKMINVGIALILSSWATSGTSSTSSLTKVTWGNLPLSPVPAASFTSLSASDQLWWCLLEMWISYDVWVSLRVLLTGQW